MKILGIETSCDETAVAIVEDGYKLLSNVISSSMDKQAVYGGVVPEIAARSHIEIMLPLITTALEQADCELEDIDAITVTYGAGLSGSLLIGVMTARTLAVTLKKPLYAANHVLGHVYANFLTSSILEGYTMPSKAPVFPMLALIVSGGHTQLVLFEDHFNYRLLGRTQDDAIGEAYDKVAKMLGFRYPGGPEVSRAAEQGDPKTFAFPIAKVGKYDFSFSGLKTAVLRQAQATVGEDYRFSSTKLPERLSELQKANIAASFDHTAIKTVVTKAKRAVEEFSPKSFVIAGGVAASNKLRQALSSELGLPISYPDMKLCTDNAAMIATLGYYMQQTRQPLADPNKLVIEPNLSM